MSHQYDTCHKMIFLLHILFFYIFRHNLRLFLINLDFFVMWSLCCRDKIINDKEKDMINKTCCNFCLSPFNHELYNQPQRQRFVHEPSKPFMIVFISQMFIIIFYFNSLSMGILFSRTKELCWKKYYYRKNTLL